MPRQFEKTLLVGSEACDELEQCLSRAGCFVTRVADGDAAVCRARREAFDAAVIVSTGEGMDPLETLFNLRDISGSMEIVLVMDRANVTPGVLGEITTKVPNTTVINSHGLELLLQSAGNRGRRTKH